MRGGSYMQVARSRHLGRAAGEAIAEDDGELGRYGR